MHLIFAEMIRNFKAEAQDDIIGIWEIVKVLREKYPANTSDEIRTLALNFIREMLLHGFVVGDSPYSPSGYRPWKNQEPAYVLRRIEAEWLALGADPNIPDIAWFSLSTN